MIAWIGSAGSSRSSRIQQNRRMLRRDRRCQKLFRSDLTAIGVSTIKGGSLVYVSNVAGIGWSLPYDLKRRCIDRSNRRLVP